MLLFMVLENPEDRDLFEWAYREYARMLKGTAYRILNDKDEAEDAVQDVFVRLMDFPERLRRIPEEEILPFLTTCTRNRALDILKKKGRVLEISYEDSFETLGETESEESEEEEDPDLIIKDCELNGEKVPVTECCCAACECNCEDDDERDL